MWASTGSVSHRLTQPASTDSAGIDSKRSPAYPKELTYPCCRQALGELGELSPHEGPEDESTGSDGKPMSREEFSGQYSK